MGVFSWIYGSIKNVVYSIKETVIDVLGFFGIEVTASHFTSEDKNYYEQWITQHEQDILKILNQDSLPDYLVLVLDSYEFEQPNGTYQVKYGQYIHEPEYNSKLLRDQIANIEEQIRNFNDEYDQNKGVIAHAFGADSLKLTPQKMVLRFIEEHLKQVVVHYTDKQQELERLGFLIEYVQNLLAKDSVKKNIRFHGLLLSILRNLNDAKIKLSHRVRLSVSKDRLHELINATNSFISDILVFLFNLFNFHGLSSGAEVVDITASLTNVRDSKLKSWFNAVYQYRAKQIDFNTIAPDIYMAEIEPCLSHNLDKSDKRQELLQDLFIPIRDLLLSLSSNPRDLEISSMQWQRLVTIQNQIIDFINIYKIFICLEQKLTSMNSEHSRVDFLRLSNLINILQSKCKSFIDALAFIEENHELFVSFRCSGDISEIYASKSTQLESRGLNLRISLTELIKKSSDSYADIISSLNITDLSEIPEVSLTQQERYGSLSEIIELLRDQYSLRGKSKKVVDNRVRQFLHELRVDGVFQEEFLDVLKRFFCLNNDECGNHCIEGLNESIDTSLDPCFVYYTVLLKIFVELIRSKLNQDDKQGLLKKFKSFLVDNFLLHDAKSIEHLIDILVDEILSNSAILEQNILLKDLIEKHLQFFAQNIEEFIEQNIGLLQMPPALIGEQQSFAPVGLVEKLNLFVNGLAEQIKQQEEFIDNLIKSFADVINLDDLDNIDKQKELLEKINNYIISSSKLRVILLKSIELLTNLINGYASFRNNYLSIIGGEAEQLSGTDLLFKDVNIQDLSKIHKTLQVLIAKSNNNLADLNDTLVRVDEAVNNTNNQAFSNIKNSIIDYKIKLFDICAFKLKCQVLFGYMQGFDIVFEYAAVNYIYHLVVDDDFLDDITVKKLTIFLNYLESRKQIISQDLSEFVGKTRACLEQNVEQGLGQELSLVTTAWGVSALSQDIKEISSGVEHEIASQIANIVGG